MSTEYQLMQRITECRVSRTRCVVRFCTATEEPIYAGNSRPGYLSEPVSFVGAAGHPNVNFGPNRFIAPSSHRLANFDGSVIAEMRHGNVQPGWGGKGFAVHDAAGAPLFILVAGETLQAGASERVAARLRGELFAIRGDEILGHTGGSAEVATESTGSFMATTAGRIAGLATALPEALVDSLREDVLGQHVEHEETIAARFTRLNETLDALLVLATMMFKLHYFDQQNV